MINITTEAQEKLKNYLAENKVEPNVRIYWPECDCSGSGDQLSLTLDEASDSDISAKFGDLNLFMAKDLSAQVGKVTIDFKDDGRNSGFVVTSEKALPVRASSCGGSCSCC